MGAFYVHVAAISKLKAETLNSGNVLCRENGFAAAAISATKTSVLVR